MKNRIFMAISMVFLMIATCAFAQKKKEKINDVNTPLHSMQPDYKTPYGELSTKQIKSDMDRVLHYLEHNTPARVIDSKTGRIITDYSTMNADARLERGAFRLTSYEWGVTYSAMQAATEATQDSAYINYVADRFRFLSVVTPHFRKVYETYGTVDAQMMKVLNPRALDDAGAMCSAMIKVQLKDKSMNLKPLIDNYINYIMYHEYRLADGTFARNRPQQNTLWLDDMFMSIPAIIGYARIASDNQQNYINEAVRQILQFEERMWIPEKGLFRHGWVEGMEDHLSFFWARANGWALLTLSEALDVLPANHPQHDKILQLFKSHVRGLASFQSGKGFWHQLLDRNDSYLETSATAIFVYCMAHAINEGWIDGTAYGPTVQLGWHSLSTKINTEGQVGDVCVGTGMGFDPAFYYHRPVSEYAAHGYGPVIWAGAEMIKLLNKYHPKVNDSAIQYYGVEQKADSTIFIVANPDNPRDVVPGTTRKNDSSPIVFLIGDSTVKCGKGKGEGSMWGWGSFLEQFFDTTRISVENWALGGRSSRTYLTERLWEKVLPGIRKGDYLIIDFGHNDGGPLNTGRARASLPGTRNETQEVVMERDGSHEVVHTFGDYLRAYIRQAKVKGATVIITSHTPGNRWTESSMNRCTDTYAKWSKEVTREEGVFYIDLNDRTALKFEAMGKEKATSYYVDSVHNTKDGAILNGKSVVEGIRDLEDCNLKQYLK